jgi:DNA-binding winged helix-turn-helix (wHTH) protein
MGGNGRSAQIIRFGIFEADLGTGELRKNGAKVALQGQPFQVFAILLERPGELATREELQKKVWPEDTFVDFEHALNTSIAKIRVALGDDANNPRFVETLPRRGYRFICPVQQPSPQETSVVADLYVMPAHGGEAKRVTFDNTWIMSAPSWTPDGRELVFASSRGGLMTLWRVPVSGGAPKPVTGAGALAFGPSVSPKGNELAYERLFFKDNIWRLNVKDETRPEGEPTRIVSEKGLLWRPQVSPDGKRIAFEANRSGYNELWACDNDGANCGQLTSLRGTAGAPRCRRTEKRLRLSFGRRDIAR